MYEERLCAIRLIRDNRIRFQYNASLSDRIASINRDKWPMLQMGRHSEAASKDVRLRIAAYLCLLLMFWLTLSSSVLKSPTVDEDNHLTRGLALLKTGDARLSQEHPPLVNMLSALPVALDPAIRVDVSSDAWLDGDWNAMSNLVVWGEGSDGDRLIAISRIPIMLLGVVLGAFIYRWANELYGSAASLLALLFFVLDPNILAHARLNTNDFGVTAFVFIAGYAVWRWRKSPASWQTTALTGLACGLALAAKHLAMIYFGLLLLVVFMSRKRIPRGRNLAIHLILFGAVTTTVVWAAYGFGLASPWPSASLKWPLGLYIQGLVSAGARGSTGVATFLLGKSSTGFWYYFPVAFLVKTPIPTILLLLLAIRFTVQRHSFPREDLILVPPVGYVMVLMLSSFNLGYRHLLPILPFLFVYLGKTAEWLASGPWARRFATMLLPVWLMIASLAIWPHYLAYFNEAAGGPSNGYKILVDSNIDWGQDLFGLRQYLDQHDIECVKLSYFGPERSQYLAVDCEMLPGFPVDIDQWSNPPFDPADPEPGIYAISVTNLQELFFAEKTVYRWFREHQPEAVIGYSIHVYRIPEMSR
jgi:hypothetical protein